VSKSELKERARAIARSLARRYPGSARELCALKHRNEYELLVATILSAQCTDERVNQVMPAFLAKYPDVAALAKASRRELEEVIRPTGFFRSKAGSLIGMARAVMAEWGGRIPMSLDDLVKLPGVGRKTASVVLSVWAGIPALPVDTHVARLARRLGLSDSRQPDRIEQDLRALLPPREWGTFSLRLILHGRSVCKARNPSCAECFLLPLCPTGLAATRGGEAGGRSRDSSEKRSPKGP
jgi:endonuclease-3